MDGDCPSEYQMIIIMNKTIYILFLVLIPLLSLGQGKLIKGKLQDQQTGESISGATIFYLQQYTFTDSDGVFELHDVGNKSVKLVINHLGYEPYEARINVNEPEALNIALKSSVKMLEEVLISTDTRPAVSQQRIDQNSIMRNDPKNVGDIFNHISGFGVIKRGGYAMDPVFRSFKYEQLNLIYDGGVYISNACPNRMDPASTQISPAEIDRIELIKGPFSVRYGQTMGGLINIITNKPSSSDELKVSGELEGGYEVNGNGITGRGGIAVVNKGYDFSVQGGAISFDDYKNGDGEIVPSAFDSYNYAAKLGINPSANQRVQLSWRQSFGKNIKHASLPMDSPKDNSSIFSVDYGARNLSERIGSLNAKAYYTYVDHLMTNENRPNFKMVEASSPVTSSTIGGRLELGLNAGPKSVVFVGTDFRSVAKDGVRNRTVKIMNGNPLDPPREFTDLIWQDSWLYDIGIFSEATIMLNERWDILAGGRIDYVKSGANNPAPDFEAQYGTIEPKEEFNLSLTASVNYNFAQNGLVQLSLGRGQRAPDLLERYINHFTVGMDAYEYIGNPNLNSEINNQVDVTVKNINGKFFWSVNLFYSYMQEYISAIVDESIPRKYMPGTEPLYTKRFINLDEAWQTGYEVEIGYNFTKSFSGRIGSYYTYAQNIDFNEPLPEITPLTGNFAFKYTRSKYWAEFRGRLVAKQDRVAASFDEATSPGFNVFDLMGGYSPIEKLEINIAFKNLFNANYFEHLSRPYSNQSETGMFYEPGRSFRVGVKIRL